MVRGQPQTPGVIFSLRDVKSELLQIETEVLL